MRAKAKATAQGQGTLRALVDAYFTTGPGSQLKSSLDQKQRIFSVFGDVLDKAADEVRQVELQLAVDNWPAPVSAGRAVSYIYGVLKWAKRRDLIPVHIELEKPTPPVINQRYLNTDELPKVLPYLDGPYGRAARFLLLTATRVGELEDMTWAEVNFDTAEWVIVGERRKDTRGVAARNTIRAEDLTVPLSRQAIALLRMVEKIENERRAIMGLPKLTKNDRVFVGNRGGKLHDWDRYCKALVKPTGVPRWSAHAMRRTAATVLGHVGCPPHIIQVALGHRNVGGALVSRYAKSRYRAEHEDALQRLADYVDGVESGGAKIIPLVKKKVR
jgi:integrase